MSDKLAFKNLDQEWIELILHALEAGIPVNEIQKFFHENKIAKNIKN